MPPTRCLSVHAAYRCRHSGACCSDVWAVPVEPRVIELVGASIAPPATPGPLFVPSREPDIAGSALVAAHHDGWCVFLERDNGRLCGIHRQGGVEALPSSCRHFPRIHLRDARGLFVTLSHFCPTAASMLFEDVVPHVVDAPASLVLDGEVEGLDAIDALPPLLRPGLLMDLDAYGLWEERAIETLARPELTHERALDAIASATERVRRWTPGAQPLSQLIAEAFDADSSDSRPMTPWLDDARRLDVVNGATLDPRVPLVRRVEDGEEIWRRLVAPVWHRFDRPVKRYLAARLFANWVSYQGRGVRSIVEWLRVCLSVLRNELTRRVASTGSPLDPAQFLEAVRRTDLLVVHRVSSVGVARGLEDIETAATA